MKKLFYASALIAFFPFGLNAAATAQQIIKMIEDRQYDEAIKNIQELSDGDELNKIVPTDYENKTILIEAIKTKSLSGGGGQDKLILALMQKGNLLDPNKDDEIKTPLNTAIQRNYIYAVIQLLDNGANYNLKNPLNGNPPIYEAALNVAKQERGKPGYKEALDIMQAILAKNPEKTNRFDQSLQYSPKKKTDDIRTTFLIFAILDEKEELIPLVIQAGADINKIGGGIYYPETTPLLAAIELNSPQIVKTLLDYGANVDLATDQGYPPVYAAVKNIDRQKEGTAEYHNATIILQMLLDKNPKKSTRFNENDKFSMGSISDIPQETTFLIYAIIAGKKALIDLLLKKIGVDPNQAGGVPGEETIPLIAEIRKFFTVDKNTIKLLLESGARVDVKDPSSGNLPIHEAAKQANIEALELLLENGAKVDSRGYLERTPLMNAAMFNHDKAVAFLIDRGADVNDKDVYGNTPLILAAIPKKEGIAEILDILLTKSNNVNEANRAGETALTKFLGEALDENGNYKKLWWGTEPEKLQTALAVLLNHGANKDDKGTGKMSFNDIIKTFPLGDLATWYKTFAIKPTPAPVTPEAPATAPEPAAALTLDELNKALSELSVSLQVLQQ